MAVVRVSSMPFPELATQFADNTSALQQAVKNADLPQATTLMAERLTLLQQLLQLSQLDAHLQPADLNSALLQLVDHYLPLELALQADLQQQHQQVARKLANLRQGSKAGKAYQQHIRY